MTKTSNAKTEKRNVAALANYSNLWGKDHTEDTEVHEDNRISQYATLVNGFYDGAADFYEYGWGRSWHFARHRLGEPFAQAIARHQHHLAMRAQLRPGMRVLDVGSGVGGPALEIARFADVKVVGINNNELQVGRANKYAKQAGLGEQVSFVKGDFTKCATQFGPNSFDAAYAIEATVHSPTLEAVYGQVFQVLKPGGTFSHYEWCWTDKYDPEDPEHQRLRHLIELGNGIPRMRTIDYAHNALQSVGFEILHEEDLAERDDSCPWYWMLRGDPRRCPTYSDLLTIWPCTSVGMFFAQLGARVLETVGIAPKGTHALGEHLNRTARALYQAGEIGIFTPMAHFACRKPLENGASVTNGTGH